jgi:hypothetical protein
MYANAEDTTTEEEDSASDDRRFPTVIEIRFAPQQQSVVGAEAVSSEAAAGSDAGSMRSVDTIVSFEEQVRDLLLLLSNEQDSPFPFNFKMN